MRTFIAIEIPREIRETISSLVEELKSETKASMPDLRWSRAEGLHITLKFLGEIPVNKVEEVKTSLGSVHLPEAFPISIEGVGYFPRETSPRVIWLGIRAGRELSDLAALVEKQLEPLGFPKEARAYSPHLTLARVGNPKQVAALQQSLRRREPLGFGSFAARDFFLYESKPSRSGSIYTKIVRFEIPFVPDRLT